MHVGDKLKDPDGGRMLGYFADYVGTAVVTREGNPASALITDSAREIVAGDVLVPETGGSVADIVPHVPTAAVHARVVSVVNGVLLAGQYQVIAINRGSEQGIEPGHVLRVLESGDKVRDRCSIVTGKGTCTAHQVTLPHGIGRHLVDVPHIRAPELRPGARCDQPDRQRRRGCPP